jgi:hypothetical protein
MIGTSPGEDNLVSKGLGRREHWIDEESLLNAGISIGKALLTQKIDPCRSEHLSI